MTEEKPKGIKGVPYWMRKKAKEPKDKKGEEQTDPVDVMLDANLPTFYFIKNFNFMVNKQSDMKPHQPLPGTWWNQTLYQLTPIDMKNKYSHLEAMGKKLEATVSIQKQAKFDLKERKRLSFAVKQANMVEGKLYDKDFAKIISCTEALKKTHEILIPPKYEPSEAYFRTIGESRVASKLRHTPSLVEFRNAETRQEGSETARKGSSSKRSMSSLDGSANGQFVSKLVKIHEENPTNRIVKPKFNKKNIVPVPLFILDKNRKERNGSSVVSKYRNNQMSNSQCCLTTRSKEMKPPIVKEVHVDQLSIEDIGKMGFAGTPRISKGASTYLSIRNLGQSSDRALSCLSIGKGGALSQTRLSFTKKGEVLPRKGVKEIFMTDLQPAKLKKFKKAVSKMKESLELQLPLEYP